MELECLEEEDRIHAKDVRVDLVDHHVLSAIRPQDSVLNVFLDFNCQETIDTCSRLSIMYHLMVGVQSVLEDSKW